MADVIRNINEGIIIVRDIGYLHVFQFKMAWSRRSRQNGDHAGKNKNSCQTIVVQKGSSDNTVDISSTKIAVISSRQSIKSR